MAENKFKVFAENASSTDILTDENYAADITRIGGNTVGIARRAPNNKALKQATLAATALGDYVAEEAESDITDELGHEALAEALKNRLEKHVKEVVAGDTNLVHTSGDETISGIKSFNPLPESSETPVKDTQLITKLYGDTITADALKKANEYTDLGLANLKEQGKQYIDSAVQGALDAAKDYTDKEVAEGGGGGGGTGGAVLAPEIISPATGSEGVIISTTFTAGPYRTAYPENLRTARQFQATRTSWDQCDLDLEVNADSCDPSTNLMANSDYSWRCRDKSSYGITGPWSEVATFTTGGELSVNQPVVSVEGGNEGVGEVPTFTGSAFLVSQGSDTHEMSSWEVYKGDAVVWSSSNNTANLTSITMPKGILAESTAYSVRVRYKGREYNWSTWSVKVSFTTAAQFDHVATPTVTCSDTVTAVTETPTFTGSAFTPVSTAGGSDTHECSEWIVKQGASIVWQSLNDSTNLTSITIPRGTLRTSTAYTVYLRYKGTTFGWSTAGSLAFTTAAQFTHIATPVLTCSEGSTGVGETPTITGSAFTVEPSGEDTHTWTTWVIRIKDSSEVYRLDQSTSALTTLNVPSGVLKVSQTYVVQAIYNGATYGSSAAGSVEFSTADTFVGPKTPTITLLGDAPVSAVTFLSEYLGSKPVYTGDDSQSCDKADWALFKGGEQVWSKTDAVAANLRRLGEFNGYKVLDNTAYELRYRQHFTPSDKWSGWATLSFTTATKYGFPTIKFKAKGTLNLQKICAWWDYNALKCYVDGAYNETLTQAPATDLVLVGEQVVEIINETDPTNYPYLCLGDGANLIGENALLVTEMLAPLPLLRYKINGTIATDFGGNACEEGAEISLKKFKNRLNIGGGETLNAYPFKMGLFARCTALTSLCGGLFRFNPQVTNMGAFGAGGGAEGGNGGSIWDDGGIGGDAAWGAGGGGGGGCHGENTGNGGNGGSGGGFYGGAGGKNDQENIDNSKGEAGHGGYGCFAFCTALTSIPADLFAYNSAVINFGGNGGGSGGTSADSDAGIAGYTASGMGGTAYGCFAFCSALTAIPAGLFDNCVSVVNFGGIAGAAGSKGGHGADPLPGGGGYGCFAFCTSLATIPDQLFTNCTKVVNYGGGNTPYHKYLGSTISDYYPQGCGCFYNTAITSIPSNLFGTTNALSMGGAILEDSKTTPGERGPRNSPLGVGGHGYTHVFPNDGGNGKVSKVWPKMATVNVEQKPWGMFSECKQLTVVPTNLLEKATKLQNVGGVFSNCSKLNAALRFKSTAIVNTQHAFSSNAGRAAVYVPRGTTTATTFKSDGTANVNVIEE